MRRFITIAASLALAYTAAASQLPLKAAPDSPSRQDPSFPQPGVMPESAAGGVGDTNQGMTLADSLTLDRKAELWWDYARDISATARLLSTGGTRTTLLVPVDSAIMKMTRKPHQNDDGSTPSDKEATENVARFIAAHVVPGDIDLPSKSAVKTMLKGFSIAIEGDGDNLTVMPGNSPVLKIVEASNGRILYLDKVVEFPNQV